MEKLYFNTHPMNSNKDWKKFWEETAARGVTDYEFDRGTSLRDPSIEAVALSELLEFFSPSATDEILDAGCGTGENLVLLHGLVRRVVGVDYSPGAVNRCRRRIEASGILNVQVTEGSLTALPMDSGAVNKIICMSVLQYLSDADVRLALLEFNRVLRPDGMIVLHVKNLSSLYLATLRLAKQVKALLGGHPKIEYVRTFSWYLRELDRAGFALEGYNSFNLLVLEGMPRSWVRWWQGFELRRYKRIPLSFGFVRRLGADLKLKARKVTGLTTSAKAV